MSAVATLEVERPELAQFRRQDVAILEMAEQYMGLTINGLDDKEGFATVHEARMTVRNTRVTIEKKRKEREAVGIPTIARQV